MRNLSLSLLLAAVFCLSAFAQHPNATISYLEIYDFETGTHKVIKDKYEIGQSGMVGFDAIFRNFGRAGTKAFVVELERASTANILKGLRESALYLRNATYVP